MSDLDRDIIVIDQDCGFVFDPLEANISIFCRQPWDLHWLEQQYCDMLNHNPGQLQLLIRCFLLLRNLRTCRPRQQWNIFCLKECPNNTGKIWSCLVIVAKQLAPHHTPITIVNELKHLIEATWATVLKHAIQSLYNSMPRCITIVVALEEVVLCTDVSEFMFPNFLKF